MRGEEEDLARFASFDNLPKTGSKLSNNSYHALFLILDITVSNVTKIIKLDVVSYMIVFNVTQRTLNVNVNFVR